MSKMRAIIEMQADTNGLEQGLKKAQNAINATAKGAGTLSQQFKKADTSLKALKGFEKTKESLVLLQKNIGTTKAQLQAFQQVYNESGKLDPVAKSQMQHYSSVLKTQERQHRIMAKSMGQYKQQLISTGIYNKQLARSEEHLTKVLKTQESVRSRLASKVAFDKKLDAVKSALPLTALVGGSPAMGTAGFVAGTLLGSGAGLATMGAVGLGASALALFNGAEGQAFRGKDTALRLMQNTGGFSDSTRQNISDVLLKTSSLSLLEEPKLIEALQVLIANGLETQTALGMLPTLAKASKGSNTDPLDMANLATALFIHMGVKPKDLPNALDVLSTSGKLGSFELNNMAQFMPTLGANFKQLGLGQKDLPAIGVMFQVSKKGAGTPEEAAVNLKNFLSKVSSAETLKKFDNKGINVMDIIANPKKYFPKAESGLEAFMLKVREMTKGGKDARALGALFPDMQAKQFILSMMQNWQEYEKTKQQSSKESAGAIERDFTNVSKSSESSLQRLNSAFHLFGQESMKSLTPLGNFVAEFATNVLNATTAVLKLMNSPLADKKEQRQLEFNYGEYKRIYDKNHSPIAKKSKEEQRKQSSVYALPLKTANAGGGTVVVQVAGLPSRQQLNQFIAMANQATQGGMHDLPV
jgi:TP901 family phage tail tape measure protein